MVVRYIVTLDDGDVGGHSLEDALFDAAEAWSHAHLPDFEPSGRRSWKSGEVARTRLWSDVRERTRIIRPQDFEGFRSGRE